MGKTRIFTTSFDGVVNFAGMDGVGIAIFIDRLKVFFAFRTINHDKAAIAMQFHFD
jgi:hypothetical protein